ncbi:hypothetical protein N7532_011161 [Penicillium argentinense]|uniref:Uncharacterized protein n=1 Tax=Penicillium argentinense TaxID=1131581 RepID=A0A9W9EHW1_9EURO|nr:uncharacterized protein N7532_011161 [Penicillium argentinense]KAJ5082118.1 hypothetical protein N7532_011161 [Penicillium argentinense]
MLAIRDQENLVNTHQTTAAAKPLNQGLKQLAPKTPGRQVPLRDENNPIVFGGKNTVKGNGNRPDNGKPGKLPPVTPMGTRSYASARDSGRKLTKSLGSEPRSRAPLGVKTNNPKTKAPQTPAPFGGALKPANTNRRASTVRKKTGPVLQRSQTTVYTEAAQDDVPDIEYMPPKSTDLPDIPDDVTYDTSFPQFQPKNRALGLESVYGKQEVGPDGLTQKQRKFQENSLKCDQMAEEMIMKQLDDIKFDEPSEDEFVRAPAPTARITRSKTPAPSTTARHTRAVSTLRSREAANALAAPRPSSAPVRVASAPKSRLPSALMPKKKTRVPTNPSSMRNTAAAVTSNNTIGYSKGRTVSSTIHEKEEESKASDTHTTLSPETYMQLYGAPPLGSEMWTRCKSAGCFDAPDEDGSAQELEENLPTFEEDDDTLNFQLAL